MSILPVIMAGGSGTRLWPLSRAKHPKQFLSLDGTGTMLQETMKRLDGLDISSSVVICNEEHRFLVAEQLRELNQLGSIILEPEGRNTAPTIALAAFMVKDDPLLLVLSADHVIKDDNAFVRAVSSAVPLAKLGKLVTFGIVPTAAHTGFGYIKAGDSLGAGFNVDQFTEKPSAEDAQVYIDSNCYYWNSGMFLFKASVYLSQLKKHRPEIYDVCLQAAAKTTTDHDFVRINQKVFSSCPSESVDYAVMENTSDAVVVPMDAGWSDIGSWSSLWDISPKDEDGNVTKGDVMLHGSKNSYVNSSDRLVVTLNIDNLVVVDTKDVLLVADKDKVQDVKLIAEELRKIDRPEWHLHREVYRPWGKYDSVDKGERYQVKRITVKPLAKLSLQKHHHRAEHWIVVSGTATVTLGDEVFLLKENESTYIPLGAVHALANDGEVNLELIEIQTGAYLGEDDIIRFEDRYGRV
jgi:mannose-1-phosphate guanylyltransferase